jgi:hypothetical protein
MNIIEVSTKAHSKEFLQLPLRIYKDDKNWIRPLDADIETVFNTQKNKTFQHGICTRWILQNKEGETIGRVAAFIDFETMNKDNEQPTGGMGFFECIDDQKAAFLLFDTCKNWLLQQGKDIAAMDGPINFGERDSWWGCLKDGFYEPVYTMNYNPAYYNDFFTAYGFKDYFQQYTYHRELADKLAPSLDARAQRIIDNPDYEFKHLKFKEIDKYAEDFRTIYNKAWGKHAGGKELSSEQVLSLLKQMKPVIDEKIIWFGYHKGEAIAFYVQILDANQVIRHVNGKMNWLGMLKFGYYKLFKKFDRVLGVVFGVVPDFQRKGVEMALMKAYSWVAHQPKYPYKTIQMKWVGDFNPKMMRVVEIIGSKIYKTHITYRKLFDETKEFKRCPVIE